MQRILLLDNISLLRYNKREEDFASQVNPLRSFNDYLEEIEDISKSIQCSGLKFTSL